VGVPAAVGMGVMEVQTLEVSLVTFRLLRTLARPTSLEDKPILPASVCWVDRPGGSFRSGTEVLCCAQFPKKLAPQADSSPTVCFLFPWRSRRFAGRPIRSAPC
jgi:hypothetical protein